MEIDPCVGVDCGSGTCVGNGTTAFVLLVSLEQHVGI